MKNKDKKKIMKILWIITDIIILICSTILLVEGGTFNIILAIIGIILVISEIVLYKKGYIARNVI
ncbi:MAG: hypothetical protein BZ135_00080 [Methanosphaera sp. rholeuAM6]|nr:MAG: hypothetical protein BZ135_00080 [Methanosphaera sp. rholeuAM6]